MMGDSVEFDRHIVILNVNEKVCRIVHEILAGSVSSPPQIVIVVQDRELWNQHPQWHPDENNNVFIVYGCPAEPQDLDAVRIDRAAAAIILADPNQGQLADARSTLVAVAVERRSPQVHTVIELISSVNRVHLRTTEVNEVICLGEISEKLIAQCCITPGIHHIFASLLAATPDTGQVFIIDLPESFNDKAYRHIVRGVVIQALPFVVCGFAQCEGGIAAPDGLKPPHQTFVINPRNGDPGKDTVLCRGDRLVVIAYEKPVL